MSTQRRKRTVSSEPGIEEIVVDMSCEEVDPPPKCRPFRPKDEDPPRTIFDPKGRLTSEGSKRSIILGELEDELERQLEEKAKRNELQGNNVKSLLRVVLTQEDVFKYVESTMAKSDELPEYQLKLTRAKAKELIDRIPEIAPLLCLPTPQKKSDIDVLIREELPEDSSDEEYQPVDDDDDDAALNASVVSSPVNAAVPKTRTAGRDENIGQRTRSKFSLSETPLEAIEQAFIPPDITEDMYNTECDNQDWLNFLKQLVQPLDTSAGQEAHDDENDPEYNVHPDEMEAPDNEELRADPAVKISKQEINDLIDELFEYTKMHEEWSPSDDEKTNEVDTLASALQYPNAEAHCDPPKSKHHRDDHLDGTQKNSDAAKPLQEPARSVPAVIPEKFVKIPVDEDQRLLIKQQFAQHVQMLLQTFLLGCGSPFVTDETREASKSCLLELKALQDSTDDADSPFALHTLNSSLELLRDYETIVNKNLHNLLKWNEEKASCNKYVKTRWAGAPPVHPVLMKLCLRSKAFPYPLLLPGNGFRDSAKAKVSQGLSRAQEHLVSSALHDCVDNLGMEIKGDDRLMQVCDLIHKLLVPDRTPKDLFTKVKRKSVRGPPTNAIRHYFLYKCSPPVDHYVVPLDYAAVPPLYLQDTGQIHTSWHRALYEERDHQKGLLVQKKRKLSETTQLTGVKCEAVHEDDGGHQLNSGKRKHLSEL